MSPVARLESRLIGCAPPSPTGVEEAGRSATVGGCEAAGSAVRAIECRCGGDAAGGGDEATDGAHETRRVEAGAAGVEGGGLAL